MLLIHQKAASPSMTFTFPSLISGSGTWFGQLFAGRQSASSSLTASQSEGVAARAEITPASLTACHPLASLGWAAEDAGRARTCRLAPYRVVQLA